MKYYAHTEFHWSSPPLENLRQELKSVKHMVDYWEKEFKERAFGEITDGDIKLNDWYAIYKKKGWIPVEKYGCCYNPVSFNIQKETVIKTGLFGKKSHKYTEDAPTQWASFKYDRSILFIWKQWVNYHQLWNYRLNKFEMTRFDLRRVTQAPKITVEEALFVCLGLSPSVIGDIGFEKFSLEDTSFEIANGIEYQDYKGNNLIVKTGIYDVDVRDKNDSPCGMMESLIKEYEEYLLIDRNEKFKCVSGRIYTNKFLKWALKHNYLKEYEIYFRDKNDSPYGEKFALELYNHLLDDEIISGKFDELWHWSEAFGWNSLHYLADEIEKMGLTPNKITYPYKAIQQYINYTGKSPLAKQYEETGDEWDKKRWVEKNELIARCLTRLELKLEEKEK